MAAGAETANAKKAMGANIWKFYLQRIASGIVFTVPIYMLFLQDNGLSVTQIMILNSIYTLLIILFDVPSGVLADRWGRKNTFIVSCAFYVLGYGVYSAGHSFWTFLIAEMVFAISTSTFGGTAEALLYDSLKITGKTGEYKKVQGNAYAITSFLYGAMGIFGGLIAAGYSYRHVYYASLIGPLIGFLISLAFVEPEHSVQVEKKSYWKHLKGAFSYVRHHPRIRFIIAEGAIISTASFLTYFLFQIRFLEIGLPVSYLGGVFALLFGAAAIGHKSCNYIEGRLKMKKSVMLVTVACLLCFTVLASFSSIAVSIAFAALLWFITSYNDVLILDIINRYTESHHRATVLSINNNSHNIIFALFSPLIGVAVDMYSITAAFLMIAALLAAYFVLMVFFFWIGFEKDGGDASAAAVHPLLNQKFNK